MMYIATWLGSSGLRRRVRCLAKCLARRLAQCFTAFLARCLDSSPFRRPLSKRVAPPWLARLGKPFQLGDPPMSPVRSICITQDMAKTDERIRSANSESRRVLNSRKVLDKPKPAPLRKPVASVVSPQSEVATVPDPGPPDLPMPEPRPLDRQRQRTLTVKEAAYRLGKSEDAIYKWLRSGRLEGWQPGGRWCSIVVLESSVERALLSSFECAASNGRPPAA